MVKRIEEVQEIETGYLVKISCTKEEKEFLKKYGRGGFVELCDRRICSRAQQRKAYALIRNIAIWQGGVPAEVAKEITKYIFLLGDAPTLADSFSLANCSVEVARLYITFLIEFCILHDVPCKEPLYSMCEDIERYVWACLIGKKCAVCGEKAELHHVDAVGMGRHRKEICHIGMKALPLCRKHHIEIHAKGKESFLEAYHLEAVKIDERIADVYDLSR